jgi:hypothetical protein
MQSGTADGLTETLTRHSISETGSCTSLVLWYLFTISGCR